MSMLFILMAMAVIAIIALAVFFGVRDDSNDKQ